MSCRVYVLRILLFTMEQAELPIVVRKSRRPVMLSFIGAVGVAVFLFWIPDIYSNSLQFGLACVFCFIAVTCLGILLEKKPDLEISTEGMQASHWNVAVIPWEEIEDVFVRTDSNGDHLCLSLSRPAEYHARAGRIAKIASIATREAGFGDLTIRPSTMDLDAHELLLLCRRQMALSKSRPKRPPSAVKYRAG